MHSLLKVLQLGSNARGTKGQFSNIKDGLLFQTTPILSSSAQSYTGKGFLSLRPADHTSVQNLLTQDSISVQSESQVMAKKDWFSK